MNEKNERNLDSTVDEIMEEIREQNVSEVKDINEKEQKSEERPRKKKVTKTKRPSGHHVSGDGVDHKAASDKDRPVKKKAPRRKKKVVREETGLLDLDGAEEWRDEEETAVPPDNPVCLRSPEHLPRCRQLHCVPSQYRACSWSF